MRITRKFSRRSFLGQVAGGVGGGMALTALGATAVTAQGRSGCTDGDSGSKADPAGNGRCSNRGRTGITDNDSGRYADPPGNGGRRHGTLGNNEASGGGRRRTGFTDGDSGANADPAGNGRGRRGRCNGLTDSDRGRSADPARCGRGRHN